MKRGAHDQGAAIAAQGNGGTRLVIGCCAVDVVDDLEPVRANVFVNTRVTGVGTVAIVQRSSDGEGRTIVTE